MNTKDKYPLISVIVPVYKAEKYIHRCIDSILNQTFRDFELILVDDGSPDKSGEICDEYAKKDDRVRVIHKENGGVASTRQSGIENVNGIYTIHADPDDWMELDMLESMYNTIKDEGADLLITDFYINSNNEEVYQSQPITSLEQEKILKDLLVKLHGGLWNKLIKTSIYRDNKIGFIEKIDYCEDVLFWIRVLQVNGLRISYLPKAFYHYDVCINENAITKNRSSLTSNTIDDYIKSIYRLVPDKLEEEKSISVLNVMIYSFFSNIKVCEYKNTLSKNIKYLNTLEISKINNLSKHPKLAY